MARGLQGGVWRHVQTLFNEGVIGDVADEQLLEWFVTQHREAGETAFEVLVERHGAMVLRICRTILRDQHDAEDAFQATFLVLAVKAASIRNRTSLASWLHGVARRIASCARSSAARRRQHEHKAASSAAGFLAEPVFDDIAEVLHEEVDRLPERYRAPILLCDMEGLTESQAAPTVRKAHRNAPQPAYPRKAAPARAAHPPGPGAGLRGPGGRTSDAGDHLGHRSFTRHSHNSFGAAVCSWRQERRLGCSRPRWPRWRRCTSGECS